MLDVFRSIIQGWVNSSQPPVASSSAAEGTVPFSILAGPTISKVWTLIINYIEFDS